MEVIVYALSGLATIIWWGTIIVAGLLFLRVIVNWVGKNPFGRVNYYLTRVTEPLVRPLRFQASGGRLRYDMMPLLTGIVILGIGLAVANVVWQIAGQFHDIIFAARIGLMTGGFLVKRFLVFLCLLYIVALLLRFILPFFGVSYGQPIMRFLFSITEPLLRPLRRVAVFGMIDFSPLIAMFIIQMIANLLARS